MDGQWNADIITPESEADVEIKTNGGLVEGDDGLGVKVDGSTIDINASGALEAIAGGGSPDVYIAEYNVTPYDDIDAAIQANKSVFVKYTVASGVFEIFPFVLKNEGLQNPHIIFQGFSDSYTAKQVKAIKSSDGTTLWSIKRFTYQAYTLFDSSLTYSYNDLTHAGSLSVANPLPAWTSADAGAVLRVNSAGTALEWGTAT